MKRTTLSSEKGTDPLSWILASITVFIWGITFVCTKHLLIAFSPLEILVVRYLAGYLFLWAMWPHRLHMKKDDTLLFALAGLTGVTVYQFTENIAISYTTASNVSIIVAVSPMWTALFSQWFLNDRHITPWFVTGFFIAITGVALVSFNGEISFSLNMKGDLIALGSSLSWGFYSVLLSAINKREYNYIGTARRIFFFSLLYMIPLVIAGSIFSAAGTTAETATAFIRSILFDWTPSVNAARFSSIINLGCLAFLGILASGFCFMAWNRACAGLGTVRATIGIYLIPVVTIVFAFLFLGEQITLMGAAGALLTIAGLVISGHK